MESLLLIVPFILRYYCKILIALTKEQYIRNFSPLAKQERRFIVYLRSVRTPRLDARRFTLDSPPRGCAGHVVHGCTRYKRRGSASSKMHEGSF